MEDIKTAEYEEACRSGHAPQPMGPGLKSAKAMHKRLSWVPSRSYFEGWADDDADRNLLLSALAIQ